MFVLPVFHITNGRHINLLTSLNNYWRLDEASGTRTDQKGNDNLTAVNTPGNAAGQIGNALAIVAASNQYVEKTSATFAPNSTDSFSIGGWVYCSSNAAIRPIFCDENPTGDEKTGFIINTSGVLRRWDVYSIGSIPLNTWTHWAYTFTSGGSDTGTERGYINGTPASSRTGSIGAPSGSGYIRLGHLSSFNHEGRIDATATWLNRVLTDAEVAYWAGLTTDIL